MVISFRMFRAAGTNESRVRIKVEDWDLGSECNCQIRVCNASRALSPGSCDQRTKHSREELPNVRGQGSGGGATPLTEVRGCSRECQAAASAGAAERNCNVRGQGGARPRAAHVQGAVAALMAQ